MSVDHMLLLQLFLTGFYFFFLIIIIIIFAVKLEKG